jgi:hypothetical protein
MILPKLVKRWAGASVSAVIAEGDVRPVGIDAISNPVSIKGLE